MPRRCWKWALINIALAFLAVCPSALAQQDGPVIDSSPIPLSNEEQAWLDGHRDLRLGLWLGTPPTIFRSDDGSVQGIIPAYLDIITRKLGLTPKRVRASSFYALWELAKAREVDMVIAITADSERAKTMLISEPYLYMPIVIVTRTDHPFISGLRDMKGRIVAMSSGKIPQARIPRDYPDIIPLPVTDPEQGLRAVESGRADAYVDDQPSIAYHSRKYGITDIRIAAITEYSFGVSFGVRKDWPILLRLVNRALASIPETDQERIEDYWTVLRDSKWVERPHVWRIVGSILIPAILLLGLIAFWNRKLAREVERRKQAEEAFRRAHEATQQIIESADVIIVGMDYLGHVKLLNRAGEAIIGYPREELIGKSWFDVVVPRERFPYAWDEFARLIQAGHKKITDTFENPILTKAGELRHILWRNSVTDNDEEGLAIIAFGTDITNRLLAEEELRLTQFAMDNAAVGVFRILPSAHIDYANRTAATMLGYTRSELKRKTFLDVMTGITQEEWPAMWERLKYNQILTAEHTIRRKDGLVVQAEFTAYYLLFKGNELAIGFFSDISERKRVEALRDDVERLVRHDLRSPTLAVQTLFKLFDRADNLTSDQRELLESVKNASRRMLNIIDMSRVLYKMEAGNYMVHAVPVDLLALAGAVVEDLRPLMRANKVNVSVLLAGEPASPENVFMVQSEEVPCYALLANLIKNAVEAASEGETVTMDLNTGEQHTIAVHNSGVIPEGIRETFFEKYVTAGKLHGTGLGTYTAHLIVVSLGGSIDFVTSREAGTTITVTLPRNNESNS